MEKVTYYYLKFKYELRPWTVLKLFLTVFIGSKGVCFNIILSKYFTIYNILVYHILFMYYYILFIYNILSQVPLGSMCLTEDISLILTYSTPLGSVPNKWHVPFLSLQASRVWSRCHNRIAFNSIFCPG